MRSSKKKICSALILVTAFALIAAQIPIGHSADLGTSEKGLKFLSDVVGLDLSSYTVKGGVVDPNLPKAFGAEDVKYSLESEDSRLDVIFSLNEGAYLWCKLYPINGTPHFVEPFTDIINSTKSFLARYAEYSGASHVQSLSDMLTPGDLKPMSTAVGDVRTDVSQDSAISWMNAVNGITNNYDIVSITIRNGAFVQFCDSWNLYKIGSADAKVPEEDAIGIARENAFIRTGADGSGRFTDFSIVDRSIRAELQMQLRTDGMLYPAWVVKLGLDKLYFNQVSEIDVSIWADTGEVAVVSNAGSYGGQSESSGENQPTVQPSAPQTNNNIAPTSIYLIVGIVATTLSVTTIALALKRRRK